MSVSRGAAGDAGPDAPGALGPLDALVQTALAQGRLPGAALWVEGPSLRLTRCWGRRAAADVPMPGMASGWAQLTTDAIYDVASLTKPVVTAPLLARLIDAGECGLDDPLGRFLPASADGAAGVTLRHLLTHSSGHAASLPLDTAWQGLDEARRLALAQSPGHPPGTHFCYSDINFILLDAVVERVCQQGFETLARAWIFEPLGMADSGFNPLRWAPPQRLVPTEIDAQAGLLLGTVHDPTCRRMGGVAGHAGLFSTVADLAAYARMVLQEGCGNGRQVLPASAVSLMLSDVSPAGLQARRALGWDLDSPYSRARGAVYARGRSVGHTGFTGCALWLDRGLQGFHVWLSNRVHPRAVQGTVDVYEAVATAAATAISDAQRVPPEA